MPLKVGKEVTFGNYTIKRETQAHAIIRHKSEEAAEPTFYEMQYMKNIAFGGDSVAIEVFPIQNDLVDGQNQRHLWLMDYDSVPNLKTGYLP